MSYLQRQKDAFKSNVQAAAGKVANSRNLAPPKPTTTARAPSPAPSNASTGSRADGESKRKREPENAVLSQPAQTGYGSHLFTQILYAQAWLKKDDKTRTLKEILGHLSIPLSDPRAKQIAARLKDKKLLGVAFTPDPENNRWDAGLYQFRPKLPVRNKEQLFSYLQSRPDAQGVRVSELKDGFADVDDAIDELEREHRILVHRRKLGPYMVWADDPSLHNDIDPEFTTMWMRTELPNVDDLVRKLLDAGQKPASEDPAKRIKLVKGAKEKKKRKARAGGKTTNTHMAHLLKDYSYKNPK